mmetsp:Transcript_43745/g.81627  ORF Transcript_43745/g.81627 Transcript_43745/m.81627 type:complete len:305 (-) Transcript_43745:221-1135(-)
MSSPSKPGGLKPAKARPLPGRRGVSPAAGSPKKKNNFQFKLGAAGDDDALSPKLLPLPDGAFSGVLGSALMPPSEETSGRFCTEGPKLAFGGPMSQVDAGCASRVPLRQFAVRLQSAISQAATLLVDRFQTLSRKDFTQTQAEDLLKLSYGVQAASYNVQKWAAYLGNGDAPVSRPSQPSTTEEALAMMNTALPRLVVAASNLQTGLRELVPAVHVRSDGLSDEEFHALMAHEKHEIEAHAEGELLKLGISIDELYSVVPHMEQMIYQASCLVNSVRHPPPVSPYNMQTASEPPFAPGPPVEAA